MGQLIDDLIANNSHILGFIAIACILLHLLFRIKRTLSKFLFVICYIMSLLFVFTTAGNGTASAFGPLAGAVGAIIGVVVFVGVGAIAGYNITAFVVGGLIFTALDGIIGSLFAFLCAVVVMAPMIIVFTKNKQRIRDEMQLLDNTQQDKRSITRLHRIRKNTISRVLRRNRIHGKYDDLLLSAENGDAAAQYAIYLCHNAINSKDAEEWLQKSARQGYEVAVATRKAIGRQRTEEGRIRNLAKARARKEEEQKRAWAKYAETAGRERESERAYIEREFLKYNPPGDPKLNVDMNKVLNRQMDIIKEQYGLTDDDF